ncbi:hypothetical protein YC2023_099705 [Brassica napus]
MNEGKYLLGVKIGNDGINARKFPRNISSKKRSSKSRLKPHIGLKRVIREVLMIDSPIYWQPKLDLGLNRLAIRRAGTRHMATPRSPYGELEQHLPALHMASWDTIIPLAIWRAETASSRSPRLGSPYGEQGRLRPARHMASMIALH